MTAARFDKGMVAQLLIDYGAEINLTLDPSEPNPLSHAAEFGTREVIELLIKQGANPNLYSPSSITHYNGRSPLHRACRVGNYEAVVVLIQNGAKVDGMPDPNNHYNTPLDEALINLIYDKHSQSLELIKILVSSGARRARTGSGNSGFCPVLQGYLSSVGR